MILIKKLIISIPKNAKTPRLIQVGNLVPVAFTSFIQKANNTSASRIFPHLTWRDIHIISHFCYLRSELVTPFFCERHLLVPTFLSSAPLGTLSPFPDVPDPELVALLSGWAGRPISGLCFLACGHLRGKAACRGAAGERAGDPVSPSVHCGKSHVAGLLRSGGAETLLFLPGAHWLVDTGSSRLFLIT